MRAFFALLVVLIVTLAVSFPITSVFGQFPRTGPIIPTTPAAPAAPVPTTTSFQSTEDDSFKIQVPQGWMIDDLDNTGSALSQEATQGYGILTQLCPQEEQQQGPGTS